MDHNDELEFELEDILREFGEPAGENEEPEAPQPGSPVLMEDEPEEAEGTEEPEEVSGDTIRLDKIRKAVSESAPDALDQTADLPQAYCKCGEYFPARRRCGL